MKKEAVTKSSFPSYSIQKKKKGDKKVMDYEIMMNGTVRIGEKAPDFQAQTTIGEVCLSDYKGTWLVFFSHPGDFTPVKS